MGSSTKTTDTHTTSSTTTATKATNAPTDLDPRGTLTGVAGDKHHQYWTESAHDGLATGKSNAIDRTKYPTLADCKAKKQKTCGVAGYPGIPEGSFGKETDSTWCVAWNKDKTVCEQWPK